MQKQPCNPVTHPVTDTICNPVTHRLRTRFVTLPPTRPDPTRPDPTRPELLKTRGEAFHHGVQKVTPADRAGHVDATRWGHHRDGMMPRSARKVVAA